MSRHRRSPRPIAGALEGARRTWQPPSPLGRAQTAWDEIGRVWEDVIGEHGPYIVERTRLVSLKAGSAHRRSVPRLSSATPWGLNPGAFSSD